jgi:hypothetical protein
VIVDKESSALMGGYMYGLSYYIIGCLYRAKGGEGGHNTRGWCLKRRGWALPKELGLRVLPCTRRGSVAFVLSP